MDMETLWAMILGALVLGYLCGSVPFGIIVTRLAGAGDIRKVGSGNIGATNVLRTGRKGLAAATLLGDALKGTLAVVLARFLFPVTGWDIGIAAALGAFIGHIYPVWLGFRGGKGVATFIGCLIGLNIWVALVFAATWLAIAYFTRYSSLAALVASVTSPVMFLILGQGGATIFILAMVLFLWWKHRDNIKRLRAGTEGKIGEKG